MHNIVTTVQFDAQPDNGFLYRFSYNGSVTINVYVAFDEDKPDYAEIDVMTLSEPSLGAALWAVRKWLDEHIVEYAHQ